MNAHLTYAAALLLVLPSLPAQETKSDPIQEAIRKFNSRSQTKPNEVSVVLPLEGEPLVPGKDLPKADEAPKDTPVLVTGKPPEDADISHHPEETPPSPPQETTEPPAPKPPQGLAVRVEKLQEGKGNIDPSKVNLSAPFPAKPLSAPPTGWRLEASESAPPLTREVELSPGKKITLKIRPHMLVPDADGAAVFNVIEPGFDPSLGYRQNDTVAALLSKSVRQLDEDSKQLGNAIDNLQQLLVSLPKPETKVEPRPDPKPEPKLPPARKK